jgi:hypothetical protein
MLYDLIIRCYWVSQAPQAGCCQVIGAIFHSLNVLLLFPVSTILNAAQPLQRKTVKYQQDSASGGPNVHRYDEMMVPLQTQQPTTRQLRSDQLTTHQPNSDIYGDDPAPVYQAQAPANTPREAMSLAMQEALSDSY